ncbi:MAG: hypothetical protein QNJ07_06795 [Woeseiaceae bacterium]|nr:hypothetical protein [Woeseiaceae bacterium]
MNEKPSPDIAGNETWTLLRDIAVLQVKLIVDGFRDLLLVPASIVAGIVSLANTSDGKPGPQFYRLLDAGKQSERWINLFGALDNSPERDRARRDFVGGDIDEIVGNLEKFVIDEYQRGGVTKQAKDQIDRALERIQRRRNKGQV